MSGLPEYIFKVQGMFRNIAEDNAEIAKLWMLKVSNRLVLDTPGPGNQFPEDTPYIATGRLRSGWTYSTKPPPSTTSLNGTHATEDISVGGAASAAKLAGEIMQGGLPKVAWLYNEVGYGHLVHEGLGNHVKPRPWVEHVAYVEAPKLMLEARAQVGGHGD